MPLTHLLRALGGMPTSAWACAGEKGPDPTSGPRRRGHATRGRTEFPTGAAVFADPDPHEHGHRRKTAGATDKGVAERIARERENSVALRRAGRINPKAESVRDHEARTLSSSGG